MIRLVVVAANGGGGSQSERAWIGSLEREATQGAVERGLAPRLHDGDLAAIEADGLNVVGVQFLIAIRGLDDGFILGFVSVLGCDGQSSQKHDAQHGAQYVDDLHDCSSLLSLVSYFPSVHDDDIALGTLLFEL